MADGTDGKSPTTAVRGRLWATAVAAAPMLGLAVWLGWRAWEVLKRPDSADGDSFWQWWPARELLFWFFSGSLCLLALPLLHRLGLNVGKRETNGGDGEPFWRYYLPVSLMLGLPALAMLIAASHSIGGDMVFAQGILLLVAVRLCQYRFNLNRMFEDMVPHALYCFLAIVPTGLAALLLVAMLDRFERNSPPFATMSKWQNREVFIFAWGAIHYAGDGLWQAATERFGGFKELCAWIDQKNVPKPRPGKGLCARPKPDGPGGVFPHGRAGDDGGLADNDGENGPCRKK